MINLKIEGYTIIAPEILEQIAERCQLEVLTIGCLRKQLGLPDTYTVVVNRNTITDLEITITPKDQVAVLPSISGG